MKRSHGPWCVVIALALATLLGAGCGGGGDKCEADTCSGHGTCSDSSGSPVCTCDTGWSGDACDTCAIGYQDDGAGNCVPIIQCGADSCSGHGTCDDTSGAIVCTCDTGYTGTSCAACDTGYHDDGTGACVADESCAADSCHNHGTCNDTSGAIVCTCDAGYGGARCDSCATGYQDNDSDGSCLPNCATANPNCSGHGTCSDTSGTAGCVCDTGYAGADCSACDAGYHDDGTGACVEDTTCGANSCNSHGTCDDSTGVVVCTCEAAYTGPHCGLCATGFQDNDGDGTCLADCTNVDLGCVHGACDDSSGTALCACDTGYAGATCTECDSGYQDNDLDTICLPDCTTAALTCSGHGSCSDAGGTAACVCQAAYAGVDCADCATGYQDNDGDGTCTATCATAGLDCGSHGSCSDASGTATCACTTGYTGADCTECATGYQDNNSDGICLPDCATAGLACGDHGDCSDASGTARCVCDTGYAGTTCADCAAGYQDNDGDGICVLACGGAGLDCGTHGACDDSGGAAVCLCDDGYTGTTCNTCDTGYQDNDGNGTCAPTCATSGLNCGTHGSCSDAGGTAVCVCTTGYAGPTCNTCATGYQDNNGDGTCLPNCATAGLNCGAHADCDDSGGTAVCVCDDGYTGTNCDQCDTGYQDNNGDGTCLPTCAALGWDCSGHGTCDDSSGTAVCECDSGYFPGGAGTCVQGGTGEDCSSPLWLDLSQTTHTGNTSGMANDFSPPAGCTWSSSAPDLVYIFDVVQPLTITFETQGYDSVLYLREDCANGPDLICDDDAGAGTGSMFTYDFEPGTYYLIVDGYSSNSGAYTLLIDIACGPGTVYDPGTGECVDDPCLDPNPCTGANQTVCTVNLPGYTCSCDPGYVPDGSGGCMPDPDPHGESCADVMSLPVVSDGSVSGTTNDAVNDASASCGSSANGPDRVYGFTISEAMRFEVQTDGLYDSVLHLRSVCGDQASELDCDDDTGPSSGSLLLFQPLQPGTYFLWVDTYGTGAGGAYTLTYSFRVNPCADDEAVCPGTPVCVAEPDYSDYECVCPAGTIPFGGNCEDDPCDPNPCTAVEHKNRCVVDDPTVDPFMHCECNIGYIDDPGNPGGCMMDPDANDWAFLVFLNADNNLNSAGYDDVSEMGAAGSTPYVHIVSLFDTADSTAKLIYVTQGGYDVLSDEGELNMSDWQVLRDFGIWAVQNYPARHYALVMWNHGAAWERTLTSGKAPSEKDNPILKGFSYDDDPGSGGGDDFISVANGDYAAALAGITAVLGDKLDIVGFDACLMGMWEVAHESAPYADYLVASSETEPFDGWAYDLFMPQLIADHTMAAADLGIAITDAYYNDDSGNSTMAVTDLNTMAAFEGALSHLADVMMAHSENKAAISTIRNATQDFYYSEDKDIVDFAERLLASSSIHQDIKTAAQAFLTQAAITIVYNRAQSDYPGSNGLSVYMPSGTPSSSYLSASWSSTSTWDNFLIWLAQ